MTSHIIFNTVINMVINTHMIIDINMIINMNTIINIMRNIRYIKRTQCTLRQWEVHWQDTNSFASTLAKVQATYFITYIQCLFSFFAKHNKCHWDPTYAPHFMVANCSHRFIAWDEVPVFQPHLS